MDNLNAASRKANLNAASRKAVLMTPKKRAKQFPDGLFHASADRLLCTACTVIVDHQRKDSCVKHLESNGHKKRVERRKKAETKKANLQVTLSESFSKLTESQREKQSTLIGLTEAFASANIPLYALGNLRLKTFLEANLKTCGAIPEPSNLRRNYLKKAFEVHFDSLKKKLKDVKATAIVCDETTDVEDRYVLNVLAVPTCEKGEFHLKSFLLDCVVLERTNFKTVSDSVISVLQKYEIPTLRVCAFVTDNATYMSKAWKCSLRPLFLNAVHVTCSAHLLNLVNEVWSSSFPEVNCLVSKVKKTFTACPARKARFKQFLRDQGESETLPPEPVITRWNTWFEAALYHAEHLNDYSEFFDREAAGSSSLNLSEARDLSLSSEVESGLAELKTYAPHLVSTLTKYEGNSILAHEVSDEFALLIEWLETPATREDIPSKTRTALIKSVQKLRSYLSTDSVAKFRQPAIDFFRACRAFDPVRAATNNIAPQFVIGNIPWFEDDDRAIAELKLYLSTATSFIPPENPIAFWYKVSAQFPKLSEIALICLSVPVNSVQAERSFSLYSDVLQDNRRSIKECNLPVYNLLYQNDV